MKAQSESEIPVVCVHGTSVVMRFLAESLLIAETTKACLVACFERRTKIGLLTVRGRETYQQNSSRQNSQSRIESSPSHR